MLFGNNIYQQNELTNSTSQESGIFEFGTVAREIKKTKVLIFFIPAIYVTPCNIYCWTVYLGNLNFKITESLKIRQK